jgi:hypothetical protein
MRNDIKIDPTGIGCESLDWIQLTQDRIQRRSVVNMVMNLDFIKTGNVLYS